MDDKGIIFHDKGIIWRPPTRICYICKKEKEPALEFHCYTPKRIICAECFFEALAREKKDEGDLDG